MPSLDDYFDNIDIARTRRARELSDIKDRFGGRRAAVDTISSKAVFVLTYANWEGFYNDCANYYLSFLRESQKRVREAGWMLMVGALHADFEALRSRNHSVEARHDFVERLRDKLECDFDLFESSVILARSNLDFEKFSSNCKILGFDINRFQRSRIKIDKELVRWRHLVAHGDSPDLSQFSVENHIDFTSNLLLQTSDVFQEAMLAHL